MPLNILAVGDSYLPVSAFATAFAALEREHAVTYLQIDQTAAFVPRTKSELRIRECAGTPEQIGARIAGVDVLVVHGAPVTAEVIDAADSLQLVGCARGGPVNVDVDTLMARDLPLVNTPGKNAEAVADLTLAFLIMLARRLPTACAFLLDGNRVAESTFEGVEFFGHDLSGKVLGLVGYGHVGSRVARRALAFGLQVHVHDPYVRIAREHGVVQTDDLGELLRGADFVSLHARAGAGAEPLVGASEFDQMKEGAYFVNTARAALVDEVALAAALASGRLAGAALDVVSPRPEDGRHPLLLHENVVLTPHIGGATHETLFRGAAMIAAEIGRFAAGEPLYHRVNPQKTATP